MKLEDVPEKAWTMKPTPIPTKQVPDWEALYNILCQRGSIVIYSPTSEHRVMTHNAIESPTVKNLLNYARQRRGTPLVIRRIAAEKWFVTFPEA